MRVPIGFGVLAFALVLGAVMAWAAVALWRRGRRTRALAERVRLEDALKHLHDYERGGRTGTLENVAGRLEITRGAASDLLSRLEERGLVRPGAGGWELTEPGRAYALRVLRMHRLWERYLADRTGVPAGEWHAAAERAEHELTPEEAERLSARLGHPRYDPHGDPIPTRRGEIPAPRGRTLTRAEPGQRVRVLHLEDEPREIFDRLHDAGLAPGGVVDVVESGGGRVALRVDGRTVQLRAVDAANVTVEPAGAPSWERGPSSGFSPAGAGGAAGAAVGGRPGDDGAGAGRRTLADAVAGEEVRVRSIAAACQGPQRRRLLDLGVVPGTRITPELVSTAGDPVAYRIRGALIALRREQARWIEVEPVVGAGARPADAEDPARSGAAPAGGAGGR